MSDAELDELFAFERRRTPDPGPDVASLAIVDERPAVAPRTPNPRLRGARHERHRSPASRESPGRMTYTMRPLMTFCLETIVSIIKESPAAFGDDLALLADDVRAKLLMLASKRGVIADENVAELAGPSFATRLEMRECGRLSSAALRSLASHNAWPLVTRLDLNDLTALDDANALARLVGGMPSLHTAMLRRVPAMGDVVLHALADACPRLSVLDAGHAPDVSQAGLEALAAACPHLASLTLTACTRVDDACCHGPFAHMHSLQVLVLNRCFLLTTAGVTHLNACLGEQLRVLQTSGCPHVSLRGVQPRAGGEQLLSWSIPSGS